MFDISDDILTSSCLDTNDYAYAMNIVLTFDVDPETEHFISKCVDQYAYSSVIFFFDNTTV